MLSAISQDVLIIQDLKTACETVTVASVEVNMKFNSRLQVLVQLTNPTYHISDD